MYFSVFCNDQISVTSSETGNSLDGHDIRVPPRHPLVVDGRSGDRTGNQLEDDSMLTTPTSRLNNSYHDAIANHSKTHFPYTAKAADMNRTLQPGNRPLDTTLTPKLPLSPLPTDLPPPPQFGNEAMTSTPIPVPPPYKEAINRSSILSNSINSNSNNNTKTNTLPGNNPGNRLSFAHHQPMIFHDEEQATAAGLNDSDRLTPSPTTHTLVLDEQPAAVVKTDTTYNFYEQQYKNSSVNRQPPTEPAKVTFV